MPRTRSSEPQPSVVAGPPTPAVEHPAIEPGTTGRYLVLFRKDVQQAGFKTLRQRLGVSISALPVYQAGSSTAIAALDAGQGILFETLGVAVVHALPESMRSLGVAATGDNPILAVEMERVVYAIGTSTVGIITPSAPSVPSVPSQPRMNAQYLRGYRDAVNHLVERMTGPEDAPGSVDESSTASLNEEEVTWGLQSTKVDRSLFSGKGIRVCVLDTGIDLNHPDFAARQIVSQSFVAGEPVQDLHGHGTHCIGTACGPMRPATLPRYGIAYNSEIYAGKVLNNQGSGVDADILAGIEWAIANECAVVSMSLAARVAPGQSYSQIFETVAKRALAANVLIVAAAGNDSHRPVSIVPVSHPANCPSIFAVAAVDSQLQVASFSNGGINPNGGQVDIAGPGVAIRSTWPVPALYNTISGTSMATPHVAGIAALLAEANPAARGSALSSLLVRDARRLPLSSQDAGSGLVQAP